MDGNKHAPELSVVICTWNRRDELVQTLQSVAGCMSASLERCEILVVDNNSSDGTADAVRQLSSGDFPIVLVHESRAGLSNARNRGVASARGPWVLFLDDDVDVAPDFLERYLSALNRYHDCGYFGGPVIPHFSGPTRPWTDAVLASHYWLYSCIDLGAPTRPFSAEQAPFGANFCVLRSHLLKYPFSENFGYRHGQLIPGEETILVEALRLAGIGGVWLADCGVRHRLPARRNSPKYLIRRSFGQGVSTGMVARRTGRRVRWAVRDLARAALALPIHWFMSGKSAMVPALDIAYSLGVLRGGLKQPH